MTQRIKGAPRRRGVLMVLAAVLAAATVVLVPGASAVTGAAFTTINQSLDGTGHCQNSAINCNIYDGKQFVWMNGGPAANGLGGDGIFFFAVLSPGGQPDPNDGAALKANGDDPNLSDDKDSRDNRTFGITGGEVSDYFGTHDYDSGPAECANPLVCPSKLVPDGSPPLIRLSDYNDTPNQGGVYILAICRLASGTLTSNFDYSTLPSTVGPKDCKYDAFKVKEGETTPPAADLFATKDATPSFTRTFDWTIDKTVNACEITVLTPNGCTTKHNSVKLTYGVTVTNTSHTDSGWSVAGTITVFNPNNSDVAATVTDKIQHGAAVDDTQSTCTVYEADGTTALTNPATITGSNGTGFRDFPYKCTYTSSGPDATTEFNHADISWTEQVLADATLSAGSTIAESDPFSWTTPTTNVHSCVNVTDSNPGSLSLGSDPVPLSSPVCAADSPKTFTYSIDVAVPHGCATVDNTATFVAADDATVTGNDTVHVKVCRVPPITGALTMGFWQNKNGQAIVQAFSGTNCASLKTFLTQFNPFNDLTAATCGTSPSLQKGASAIGVVGYVYNVIKAAVCTSTSKTCNSMLRAQMLATALDVYFSASSISLGSTTYPGGALNLTLGGNRIGAPSAIAAAGGVGAVPIDLTQVCNMIDGSGGTATCSGTFRSVANEFGGINSLTVIELLYYMNANGSANGNGNPVATLTTGASWYLQIKAKQVNAKDAFDAINNQVAFTI